MIDILVLTVISIRATSDCVSEEFLGGSRQLEHIHFPSLRSRSFATAPHYSLGARTFQIF